MAYPSRRRRNRRRRFNRKYKGTGYTMMKKVAQKVFNKNAEVKYTIDHTAGSINIDTTGTIAQVATPTLGTSVNERTGNEIRIRSIQFKGSVVAGDATNFVRFIIFQWKSRSPTAPVITDILDSTVGGLYYNNLYNKTLGSSFKILYDKMWAVNSDGNDNRPFHALITKGFDRRCEFNSGTTLGHNTIWWLAVSDSAIGDHPQMNFALRMNYNDA